MTGINLVCWIRGFTLAVVPALLLIVASCPVGLSQEPDPFDFVYTSQIPADSYFPARQPGLWGFLDRSGKFVIKPAWQGKNLLFHENRAVVQKNGKWGFIDTSGKLVVEPKYEDAYHFFEGLAAVKLNSKWGFIDASGKTVIPHKIDLPDSVLEDDDAPCPDDKPLFCQGLACVFQDGKMGFIDRNGKIAIKPQFERALNFVRGTNICPVRMNGKWGFIDRTGKFVVPPKFSRIGDECERITAVFADDRWGFVMPSGKFLDVGASNTFPTFSEGLAAVKIGSRWGFVNEEGALAIKPVYDGAFNFSEGKACIKVGDSYGFIDMHGKTVIEPQLAYAGDFSEGLVSVRDAQGFWGFKNEKGEFAIPLQPMWTWDVSEESVGFGPEINTFPRAPEFTGIALVKDTSTAPYWYFIDKKGKEVPDTGCFEPLLFWDYDDVTERVLRGELRLIFKTGKVLRVSGVWSTSESVIADDKGRFHAFQDGLLGVSVLEPADKEFVAGMSCKGNGGYMDAIAHFSAALKLRPDYPAAIANRGDASFLKGEYESALADYQNISRSTPSCARAIAMSALCSSKLNRVEDARAYKNQTLKVDRNLKDTLLGDCRSLDAKNLFALSGLDLELAEFLFPKDALVVHAVAQNWFDRTRHQECVDAATRCLALSPQFAPALRLRGVAYTYMEKNGEAVADFSRLIELEPASHDGYYQRGLANYSLKRFKESVRDLEESRELNPEENKGSVASFLARSYFKSGDRKRALEECKTAIDLGEKDSDLLEMRGDINWAAGEYLSGAADKLAASGFDLRDSSTLCIIAGVVFVLLFGVIESIGAWKATGMSVMERVQVHGWRFYSWSAVILTVMVLVYMLTRPVPLGLPIFTALTLGTGALLSARFAFALPMKSALVWRFIVAAYLLDWALILFLQFTGPEPTRAGTYLSLSIIAPSWLAAILYGLGKLNQKRL